MIGTAVVMAGLLSISAISGKRKVRSCHFRQLRLFLVATGEVMMAHAKKPASIAPTGSKTTGTWEIRKASGPQTSSWEVRGKKASPSKEAVSDAKLLQAAGTGEFLAQANAEIIESLKDSGFSVPEITRLVVSKRSLERRRQKQEPLSATESDRALRLSRIHDHAVRVFGSAEKANRWLRKPCRALDGTIPLDLLASETGAHIVESELHAIDHGMFA